MEPHTPKSKQPLPDHAEKVFSGKIFDVYQWEQEMYDGSTAIFEKAKRPDTVIVFGVLDDNRIILTKQQQPGKEPFIGGAGGRVDPDETPLQTAHRELLEETGYTATEMTLWTSVQPVSKLVWSVYIYIAKGLEKSSDQKLDGGEKVELYPVTFEEFLTLGLQDNFSEQEVYRSIVNAHLSPQKKAELQNLLSN